MEGQVYNGSQGKGYATTFPFSKSALAGAQKQGAVAKARQAGAKQTAEIKPNDVWHYYGAETQARYQNWLGEGAQIMTDKGINNPWQSTDPDAIQWQINAANMKQAEGNIQQAQEMYIKATQAISTRGDEYDPEYIDAVKNFPLTTGYDQIASGNFQFPQAKFKNPSKIYSKFFIDDSEVLKGELDGRPPTDSQLKSRVNTFFTSPDNEAELTAARQMYSKLPPAQQTRFKAVAELQGFDDPAMGLVFSNYKNQFNVEPQNAMTHALDYAKVAAKDYSSWSSEDTEGVTSAGSREKLADKEYPLNAAKSHFEAESYLLDDEAYMRQLNVPMTVTRQRRKELATAELAKRIEANIDLKATSKLSRTGGGLSKQELGSNFDVWRERIGGYDQTAADEAANWLFGTKGGDGTVAGASVIMESSVPLRDKITDGAIPNHRVLVVKYNDPKAARAAKEKFYKQGLRSDEEGTTTDEGVIELMNFYDEQSTSTDIMFPVTPRTEQILKELHNQSARSKKSLYEPEVEVDPRATKFNPVIGGQPRGLLLDAPPSKK